MPRPGRTLVPQPRSRFIRIKCPECGNVQVTFSHASTTVQCFKCGKVLVEPSGGKATVIAEVIEVLR
ncbi:MAG: 30S ribosomal protein S27e [Thermofilum sp.]|uniref:Small ribosomal subunit protein eS27 n=1 Tax=Thermofilum pendens TaxID=2269 RepID=A0A7C4H3J5_THEPE